MEELSELDAGNDDRALIEIYNDTQSAIAEAHNQFATGMLNLQHRAWAEMSLRITNLALV